MDKENYDGAMINVLLVEDDVFLVELLEKKFSQSHIYPFIAFGADDARSFLEKEKIDAILLDIILPDADGIDFLKKVKENSKLKKIPVIIISNLSQKEDIQKGLSAGADFYLVKSNTTTDEIVNCIKDIVKK